MNPRPQEGKRVYFRESSAQENLQSISKAVLEHMMNAYTPGHSVIYGLDNCLVILKLLNRLV